MRYFLLMIAVVALVGCGKEDPSPTAPSSPKNSAEAKKQQPPKVGFNSPVPKAEKTNLEPTKVVPEKLIADPIVEKEVRESLKKPKGELTRADLETVTKLNLFFKQLTDVKGLENLTQLTYLRLSQNQLTNVKGLEKLTQLTSLNLGDNQLTDVKGLEKLTQLTNLGLGFNQLTDVNGLEKLKQLKELILQDNQLTDMKGLEKLTQLKKLYLYGNPDLTKAQIDELQKALPKCRIHSNPTK